MSAVWKYRPVRQLFISTLDSLYEERLSTAWKGNGMKKNEDTAHEESSSMTREEDTAHEECSCMTREEDTVHEESSSMTREEDTVHEESSSMTREDNGSTEELLPGIADDVTLQVIGTKLPWSTLHILSSVSRAWQEAMRGHEIHDARVRSGSRDKLVVLNHTLSDGTCGIALYCLRTDACIQLPPIPDVKSGIPQCCECITLDGKIYILGGLMEHTSQLGSADVYMLDLVLGGHWQWKKCASMHSCRLNFGCGVIAGKIYVCGGSSLVAPVCGTEVYDPKEDAWTELMPMRSWRTGHKVGIVNDELVVYDGRMFFPSYLAVTSKIRPFALERWFVTDWICTEPTAFIEIYNPATNEWRLLNPEMQPLHSLGETLFVADGQLYCITGSAMIHLDLENGSRTRLQSIEARKFSNSSDRFSPPPPTAALALGDQLLALDYWYEHTKYMGIGQIQVLAPGPFLLRARGLGTKDKEIEWERAPCSLSFESLTSPLMCPLLL